MKRATARTEPLFRDCPASSSGQHAPNVLHLDYHGVTYRQLVHMVRPVSQEPAMTPVVANVRTDPSFPVYIGAPSRVANAQRARG